MSAQIGIEHCLSFINCHLQPPHGQFGPPEDQPKYRALTISRQTGSGGHAIAEKLVGILQAQPGNDGGRPWTVFDKNLVEKVLEDHHLPNRLAKFMHEDRISEISDTMDELFGLHPPSWDLVHKVADTILHLVELGNVIIIGRGGHIVTRKLDYVYHIRLVGSFEKRVLHIQEKEGMSAKEAAALVTKEDLGRRRFLRKYFDLEIDDPLLYHLMLNTDLTSYEEAARIIAQPFIRAPKAVSA
jgi:cytidylate kinase